MALSLETPVDRSEMMVTIWTPKQLYRRYAYQHGAGRYDPWCTPRAAPGCVTIRWNRTTIPPLCSSGRIDSPDRRSVLVLSDTTGDALQGPFNCAFLG